MLVFLHPEKQADEQVVIVAERETEREREKQKPIGYHNTIHLFFYYNYC